MGKWKFTSKLQFIRLKYERVTLIVLTFAIGPRVFLNFIVDVVDWLHQVTRVQIPAGSGFFTSVTGWQASKHTSCRYVNEYQLEWVALQVEQVLDKFSKHDIISSLLILCSPIKL